jgi:hypothetical protein
MADYCGTLLTTSFHVKDEVAFLGDVDVQKIRAYVEDDDCFDIAMGRRVTRKRGFFMKGSERWSFSIEPSLLTVAEAAARLHVTHGWVYRNWKTIHGARKLSHRQLRFSVSGLERWQRMRQTT